MAGGATGATALLGIDWGTSSLRGARLDENGQVLEERAFPHGILTVPAGGFGQVFEACFGDWARDGAAQNSATRFDSAVAVDLERSAVQCLISGMAGSQQGWVEARYCACPAGFADVVKRLRWIEDPALPIPTAIVPGLSCQHASTVPGLATIPDVMRGEEVQILGAMVLGGWRDGLCILPGTHSKWARVVDGRVVSFRTYMTGEFYAMLSQHSLLARSIDLKAAFDPTAFAMGVAQAREGGSLLHHAFGARTLSLFARLPSGPLASYLSGLVIGEELRELNTTSERHLTLVGSQALTFRYALACETIGITTSSLGAEAGWTGLHALSRHLPQPAWTP